MLESDGTTGSANRYTAWQSRRMAAEIGGKTHKCSWDDKGYAEFRGSVERGLPNHVVGRLCKAIGAGSLDKGTNTATPA